MITSNEHYIYFNSQKYKICKIKMKENSNKSTKVFFCCWIFPETFNLTFQGKRYIKFGWESLKWCLWKIFNLICHKIGSEKFSLFQFFFLNFSQSNFVMKNVCYYNFGMNELFINSYPINFCYPLQKKSKWQKKIVKNLCRSFHYSMSCNLNISTVDFGEGNWNDIFSKV